MAIRVNCVCGSTLQAKDEWAGRNVRCPKCGQSVKVPETASHQTPGAHPTDILFDEAFSDSPASAGGSPFADTADSASPEKSWFSWLFWSFPSFSSALKWREPPGYRIRLRGDFAQRLIVVFAVWAAAVGLFLALFAVNNNPPGIPLAIGLGAVFAGLAMLAMFFKKKLTAGQVKLSKQGLQREQNYVSIGLTGSWYLRQHWEPGSITRCVIVPSRFLGRSFSAMLVYHADGHELMGIPAHVNVEDVRRELSGIGVRAEAGRSLPDEYTTPMSLIIPFATSGVCAICLLAGLGFYLVATAGNAPRDNQRQARFDQMRQMTDQVIRDLPGPNTNVPGNGDPRQPALPPGPAGRQNAAARQQPAEPPGTSGPRQIGLPQFPAPGTFPRRSFPGGRFPAKDMDSTKRDRSKQFLSDPSARASGAGPNIGAQPGDTALAGGDGGAPFRMVDANGRPVIGFEYDMGSWAGEAALRRLDPLYDRDRSPGRGERVLARDGYAVAAIHVAAGNFVNAVQVEFMRVSADGGLDTDDAYSSPWIGQPGSQSPVLLGRTGELVLGVYGRKVAVLDAVGLVMHRAN